MKHIPTTLLPALALLTLGGCATTNGLTTTEPDGIYYSSKDRTTELATASTANQPSDYAASDDPNAVDNPDYRDSRTRSRGSSSDAYYDDSFDYNYWASRRRYNGLGMTSYYGLGYTDPFWYAPTLAYGPSWYGGGFYDPFWGPSWYGGSYVNVNIGWGYGGWGLWGPSIGYGYGYRPYGYGYPYGGYGYGGGGYYNGFYDGYYSGLYGGGRGYWNGYRDGGRNVNYHVAPRRDRGVEVVGSTATGGGGRPRVDEATGGRSVNSPSRYRSRVEDANVSGGGGISAGGSGLTAPASSGRVGRVEGAPQGSEVAQPGRGRLYRISEANPAGSEMPTGGVRTAPTGGQMDAAPAGNAYEGRGRGRVRDYGQGQPSEYSPQQPQEQPQQYSRPRREQRYSDNNGSSEQPVRRERTYEAPTRSYEAPTRSYERSGGNFGGGSFGGGGGGRSSGGGGGGGRGRVQ